jgi:hypothetical protein
MNWSEIEKSFIKAWGLTFSRSKIILCFATLTICGLFFVFSKALAVQATPWVQISLIFLPILLSSGFLLTLGTLLIRLYQHEVKGLSLSFGRLFAGSFNVAMGTTYLSLPPIVAYLLLWIALGFFFLLKEIPFIGPFFNVILAFGPFFLIFCSLLLVMGTVGLLFFLAPLTARSSHRRLEWSFWHPMKEHPFHAVFLLLIALLPALVTGGLLTLAAAMTSQSFAPPAAALPLEWFIVMIPFCALLSPSVIFFFHFAQEGHDLLQCE